MWRHMLACLLLSGGSLLHATSNDPVILANKDIPRLSCQVKQDSDNVDALRRGMVQARMEAGALHAAYAEVLALPSGSAEAALLRAHILRKLGRPEAAGWYDALRKTCLQAEAWHGLGLLAASGKDWELARDRLIEATRLKPADSQMQGDLGFVLMQLAAFSSAEFALRTAHELQPEAALPRANLQLLSIVAGNASLWQEAATRWPLSQEALESLMRDCRALTQASPRLAAIRPVCVLP